MLIIGAHCKQVINGSSKSVSPILTVCSLCRDTSVMLAYSASASTCCSSTSRRCRNHGRIAHCEQVHGPPKKQFRQVKPRKIINITRVHIKSKNTLPKTSLLVHCNCACAKHSAVSTIIARTTQFAYRATNSKWHRSTDTTLNFSFPLTYPSLLNWLTITTFHAASASTKHCGTAP